MNRMKREAAWWQKKSENENGKYLGGAKMFYREKNTRVERAILDVRCQAKNEE